jgi:hypothetical protein
MALLLAAVLSGGVLGCGYMCNYGLSPCPVDPAPGLNGAGRPGAKGHCPTEYRPTCIEGDSQCTTDKNGCTVCDCVPSRLHDMNHGDPSQRP